MTTTEMLTPKEHEAMTASGRLWGLLTEITGNEPTRAADLNELVVHIHAIQHAIMSQAAGRAYPQEYRLLGETFSEKRAAPVTDPTVTWPPQHVQDEYVKFAPTPRFPPTPPHLAWPVLLLLMIAIFFCATWGALVAFERFL